MADQTPGGWLEQLTVQERIRTGNPNLVLRPIEAAALLAQGLMRGDPATFKQGYTRENAVIAAQEMYPEFTRQQISDQLAEFETNQP